MKQREINIGETVLYREITVSYRSNQLCHAVASDLICEVISGVSMQQVV